MIVGVVCGNVEVVLFHGQVVVVGLQIYVSRVMCLGYVYI